MLDFLLFMVQEESSRGRIVDVCASLAVLEDAGQVPQEFRISSCRIWLQATSHAWRRLRQAVQSQKSSTVTVAMIISLEISVTSSDKPFVFESNVMDRF